MRQWTATIIQAILSSTKFVFRVRDKNSSYKIGDWSVWNVWSHQFAIDDLKLVCLHLKFHVKSGHISKRFQELSQFPQLVHIVFFYLENVLQECSENFHVTAVDSAETNGSPDNFQGAVGHFCRPWSMSPTWKCSDSFRRNILDNEAKFTWSSFSTILISHPNSISVTIRRLTTAFACIIASIWNPTLTVTITTTRPFLSIILLSAASSPSLSPSSCPSLSTPSPI